MYLRAGSIRAIAGLWWFFVLIMVSSYTANLAAFLTAVKMGNTINNVEELAAQSKVKYGSQGKGSTAAFFSVIFFFFLIYLFGNFDQRI